MTRKEELVPAQLRRRFDLDASIGDQLHGLAKELWPLDRSLTGEGVRETLRHLQDFAPMTIHEVPTGTQAFDWSVPREWAIREAYIVGPSGERVVDFRENNLHVVGYSCPVDRVMTLAELRPHLYSLPEQPDAVPYVTSYYRERWGFCLSHRQLQTLVDGDYHVVIDSSLFDGALTYGELLIRGDSADEVFLSTYVCHPSMANNELSGPVVASALAQWVLQKQRRFTYRFIFIPETIGSIVYLSRHLEELRENVVAGFNLTCIGDDRAFSYLPSRAGDTLADRAALAVLTEQHPGFIPYSFLDRGSDERQYCSPGVDLPVASIMRSKYREYPEYHTSLDDLELVTPAGLEGGYNAVRDALDVIERNRILRTATLGEPQLGKYGLYPSTGTKRTHEQVRGMLDLLAYADGSVDLLTISERIHLPISELLDLADRLEDAGLLEVVDR